MIAVDTDDFSADASAALKAVDEAEARSQEEAEKSAATKTLLRVRDDRLRNFFLLHAIEPLKMGEARASLQLDNRSVQDFEERKYDVQRESQNWLLNLIYTDSEEDEPPRAHDYAASTAVAAAQKEVAKRHEKLEKEADRLTRSDSAKDVPAA